MANYDFSTLNDADLEELVCDLLNANKTDGFKIELKTFKEGKDKGIDILGSTERMPHAVVGQVKHYLRSGYNVLYRKLKNEELDKVRILAPRKYFVATSVNLLLSQSKEILKLFQPYIKSLSHIYGSKDLNKLLDRYPRVLDAHFKLWFSDTEVLCRILNSRFYSRSLNFTEDVLKKRVRMYVMTEALEKARLSLKKNKFVMITGEPGVGKTTLAELLALEYIGNHYQFTLILDDIREVDKVLKADNTPQVMYFDDFLGSTDVEIDRARSGETALLRILARLKEMENKYLILTTRSLLLSRVYAKSEKLRRFDLKNEQCEIKLSMYSKDTKKRILENHVHESTLSDGLKSVIMDPRLIDSIVDHRNYSPRAIEFVTAESKLRGLSVSEYAGFIKKTLEVPLDIWKHAYEEQITEDDRLLLNTFFSFGDSAHLENLATAFDARLKLESGQNNKMNEIGAFNKSLRRLLDGFIVIGNSNEVYFINPSVIDFLKTYIGDDHTEMVNMQVSAVYIQQLTKYFYPVGEKLQRKLIKSIDNRFQFDTMSFISPFNVQEDLFSTILVIHKYSTHADKYKAIIKLLSRVRDWSILSRSYQLATAFKDFMISSGLNDIVGDFIHSKSAEIVSELIAGEEEPEAIVDLVETMFPLFSENFNSADYHLWEQNISELINSNLETEIDWLKQEINDEGEVRDLKEKIERYTHALSIHNIDIDMEFELHALDDIDWHDYIYSNHIRRVMEKND